MIQHAIVFGVVAVAVAYAIWRGRRRRTDNNCGGCSGCCSQCGKR